MSNTVYEIAICKDFGSYYVVVGVTKNTLEGIIERDKSDCFLKLSYSTYLDIKEAIENKKEVRISKRTLSDEVLPSDLILVDDKRSELDIYKQINQEKIQKALTYKSTNLGALSVIEFIINNNELASRGFFITKENKEEKYLEIVEHDDAEILIDVLEKYILSLEKMQDIINFKNKCDEFKDDIELADDKEEVDSIVKEFYKYLNLPKNEEENE